MAYIGVASTLCIQVMAYSGVAGTLCILSHLSLALQCMPPTYWHLSAASPPYSVQHNGLQLLSAGQHNRGASRLLFRCSDTAAPSVVIDRGKSFSNPSFVSLHMDECLTQKKG